MNALVAAFTIFTIAGQPASGPVGPAPAPAPAAAPPAAEAPATSAPPPASAPAPSSSWDDDPVAPAPAPVIIVQTAPADQAPPPPAKRPKDRVGSAVLGTGIAFIAIGASSWLFIAMPAAITKRVALNRASRDPVFEIDTRRDRYERARRADDAMEAGFWIGVAGLTSGITLTIVGAVLKSRFKRRMAEERVAATAGGLEIRF
jgi:hypothetical protein